MIRFNPEVSVGNIILAITVLGTATAGIFGGYNRISEHELRLNALDHEILSIHTELQENQSELRKSLQAAVDILTDLRIQVGVQKHGR